jgi:UDP-glucose pyrophosphorylase
MEHDLAIVSGSESAAGQRSKPADRHRRCSWPEGAPNGTHRAAGILTPKIFDKLEFTARGAGGEIQLTDATEALIEEQPVYAYEFDGTRYDAGTTMGWLHASVELALQRPEFAGEFREYLRGLEL